VNQSVLPVLVTPLHIDQPDMYETYSQKIEASSQLEGSGTTPGAEGKVYFKQKSKMLKGKCSLITKSSLTSLLRGADGIGLFAKLEIAEKES
jgi:hypothetical protein